MNYSSTSTPWGKSQGGHSHFPGMVFYHTAGHGGLKVDARLNRQIPLPFRNLDGWYEEDCEYAIPVWWFHDKIVAFTLEHQAHRLDGYNCTPLEHWTKFPRQRFEDSVREWSAAAWAIHTGIDLEDEVRQRSIQRWAGPHYDQSRLQEYVGHDVESYRKSLEFILAKREPVPFIVGDVIPLVENCSVAELTVTSVKPALGTDSTGKLWRISRKLIAWSRFPRSAASILHRPKRVTASGRAALLLANI